MKKSIVLLLMILPFACLAQVNISGRVINKANGEPVSSASIFLSNATIGTKTADDGTFTLNKVKTGKYDLVVSIIGFESYHQVIIVNATGIALADISIVSKTISLMEVEIKPQSNTARQRNIQLFINEFIGTSALARDCKLINPDMLDVDFDETTNTLTASSVDFLVIENRGLGYRLKYLVGAFSNSRNFFGSLKTHYEGSVFFENLSGTPSEEKRWKKNREQVYENSPMHFLRSVITNQVQEEGFRVFQYANEPNPERPGDDLIAAKITQFTKLKAGGSKRYSDSLSYWVKKSKLDKSYLNLRNFFLNQPDILKPTDVPKMYALNCEMDGLHITYNQGRHFSKNGTLNHLNDLYNTETSVITFNTPSALIDNNGNLTDPNSLSYSGAWTHYRVAELLPVDYERSENSLINQANNKVISTIDTMPGIKDSIIEKLALYKLTKPKGLLYLHIDKTIYTYNETVWFTAHLLNSLNKEKHNTLSVALINSDDRKIVLKDLFVLNNGLGYGNLTIPDTIPTGNYYLLAYTNRLDNYGKPVAVYKQAITIKTNSQPTINASLRLIDTVRDAKGNLKAIVTVENKNPKVKPVTNIEYAFGQNVSDAKTNIFGEYLINIPPTAGSLLRVTLKQGKDVQFLSLNLPVLKGLPAIRFYPEGGNMVTGTSNLIAWEARSSTGEYLKLSGVLCKNGKPTDTITTNFYGIGKFKLIPEQGCKYSFRVIKSGSFATQKDTVYNLPMALPRGIALHVINALAEDTLNIRLRSSKPQKVILLAHNYNDVIAYRELSTGPDGNNIKILLNDAPKGLSTITLLDSLGRPLAERLFFAHYKQNTTLTLETDKQEYTTREKVTLRLKLKNINGELTNGTLSIACVQDNRIEGIKQTDIATYTYLKHDLEQLPADPLGKNYDNPEYVQDLLLVKGWRRYTWDDVLKTKSTDTLKHDSSANFEGSIKIANEPLKKAVTITVSNGKSIQFFDTKSNGVFEMPISNMITGADKKINLLVAGKIPELYTISIVNPYVKINDYLASNLEVEQRKLSTETNTRLQMVSGFEKAIALKEVFIKDYNSDSFMDGVKWHKPDEKGTCNDYVCLLGYLNCPAHKKDYPGSYPPFIGGHYKSVFSTGDIIYKGCILFIKDTRPENFKLSLKGINMAKEYYPMDEAMLNNAEPEFLSTIYWNYGVKLDTNNEVNLSFYTGDITGRFRVIVQGAGENEVWSKRLNFTVKKKVDP